jgi:hypothetical protein
MFEPHGATGSADSEPPPRPPRAAGQADRVPRLDVSECQYVAPVSAGVGLMPTPSDGDALYRLADRALYEAKQNGRNRTCCHAGDPSGLSLAQSVGDDEGRAGLRPAVLTDAT